MRAFLAVLLGVAALIGIAVAAYQQTEDLPLPGSAAFFAIGGGLVLIALLVGIFVWLQRRGR